MPSTLLTPNEIHQTEQPRKRSAFIAVPLLFALAALPGCAEQKTIFNPEDGLVIKNGKSLSFDLLKGKLDTFVALDKQLDTFLKKDLDFIQKIEGKGVNVPQNLNLELFDFRRELSAIRNTIALASSNPAFEPTKKDFQKILSLIDLVDVKSSPENLLRQGGYGLLSDPNSFAALHATLREELTDLHTGLSATKKTLSSLSLRALTYETETVLSQTISALEKEGRGSLTNDTKRYEMLLAALDRYIGLESSIDISGLPENLASERRTTKESLVYARSLLADTQKFSTDPDDENQFSLNAVRASETHLANWHVHLRTYLDQSDPNLANNLADNSTKGSSVVTGGGGSSVRHHYYYHSYISSSTSSSYSSSPSVNYGGKSFAFSGSKGSFSAPHTGAGSGGRVAVGGVARGGFGAGGHAHAGAGT